MSARDDRVRDLISEQAAVWFVANRGRLSSRERQNFAEWLRASPVHVEEYLALTALSEDLRRACDDPDFSIDALVSRAKLEDEPTVHSLWGRLGTESAESGLRWRPTLTVAASLSALALGVLVWRDVARVDVIAQRHAAVAPTELHFKTRHGEQRTETLADRSVLHLNTDSAVIVRFGSAERGVELTAGEADFEVAHDAKRVFQVIAGGAQMVAIGTQFDVRLVQDSTVVTVVEGRVAIGPTASPTPQTTELRANQRLSVANGQWPAASAVAVDAQAETAWMHRQITFDHEPLERVAGEFNRYSAKPFEIVTPGLRKLEISGVFATDDTTAFIAFLRRLDGVRVDETTTRVRVTRTPH